MSWYRLSISAPPLRRLYRRFSSLRFSGHYFISYRFSGRRFSNHRFSTPTSLDTAYLPPLLATAPLDTTGLAFASLFHVSLTTALGPPFLSTTSPDTVCLATTSRSPLLWSPSHGPPLFGPLLLRPPFLARHCFSGPHFSGRSVSDHRFRLPLL